MKNIWITILIAGLMAGGCTIPVNTLQTVPLTGNDTIPLRGFVYSLPLTTLKIDADIVMTRTIRGPYYRFAEKYMGIINVPRQSSIEWNLATVRLETLTESDPASYYLIRSLSGKPDMSGFVQLRNEGLVVDINLTGKVPLHVHSATEPPDPIYFKDISIESNVLLSSDTLYKTILTDSTFIKVPVLRNQLIERTIDEKAREAADLIFKLRKRRFHLVSANYDLMPQGVAMEHAIKELDELEEEYLSLFIGKQYAERETLTFYFTPDPDEESEHIELFEFSRSNGVVSRSTADSEVVSLKITQEGKTAMLKSNAALTLGSTITNAVYYRVPDRAGVSLDFGSRSLIRERIPVYQYGVVLSMPVITEN